MVILFQVLTFVFFIALLVGLVRPKVVLGFGKTKTRGRVLLIYGVGLLAVSFAGASIQQTLNPTPPQPPLSQQVSEKKEELAAQKSNEGKGSTLHRMFKGESESGIPETVIDRIPTLVHSIADYSVGLYNGENIASVETPPPYEVIVNTSIGAVDSCITAKHHLFEIMKALYTDPIAKKNISRVLVTIFGFMRASLGADDAKFSWEDSGPTNFWRIVLQYKSYEDETGPLSQRTWGVPIKDCL